jgi:hypothetical protein
MNAKKIVVVSNDGNAHTYIKVKGKNLYFNDFKQNCVKIEMISKKETKFLKNVAVNGY